MIYRHEDGVEGIVDENVKAKKFEAPRRRGGQAGGAGACGATVVASQVRCHLRAVIMPGRVMDERKRHDTICELRQDRCTDS